METEEDPKDILYASNARYNTEHNHVRAGLLTRLIERQNADGIDRYSQLCARTDGIRAPLTAENEECV